jgi:hypothetical protein
MRRTLLIAFVLAVLSGSAAYGLQTSSAKSHKSIASATASHNSATVSHKRARHPANRVASNVPSHAPGHAANRAPGHLLGRSTRHESGRPTREASARKHAAGPDAHPASHQQPSRSHRVANSHLDAKPHSEAKLRRVVNFYPARKLTPATKRYEGTATATTGRPILAKINRPVVAAPDHPAVTAADRAAIAAAANAEAGETASVAATEPNRTSTAEAVALRKTLKTIPPPLRGSLESLVRQNEKTEADNLERIEDDSDLNDRIARGMLVPVPVSATLTINGKLPENRRYCRPWTATFLIDLGRAHTAAFHRPLEVSSAVRTVAYQKQLERINGNATAAEGDIASPHLTGAAIDIAKQGMTRQEIGWMRAWLLPLEKAGEIDVEEEFRQSCFHITVYKSYTPPIPPREKTVQATTAQSSADKSGL